MTNPSDTPNPADFDAADLADAILGPEASNAPLPPPPTMTRRVEPASNSGAFIGPALIVALFAAVGLAIILAIAPASESQPPVPCGGLYSECCDGDDYRHTEDHVYIDCEPECDPRQVPQGDKPEGLFDAEERFSEDPADRC